MDCPKANLHQLNRPWLRPRDTPRLNQCTLRPEPVEGTRYLVTSQSDPKLTRLLERSNTASTSPNDQCRRVTLQRLTLRSSTSHGIPIQHWPRTPAEGPCPGKCLSSAGLIKLGKVTLGTYPDTADREVVRHSNRFKVGLYLSHDPRDATLLEEEELVEVSSRCRVTSVNAFDVRCDI